MGWLGERKHAVVLPFEVKPAGDRVDNDRVPALVRHRLERGEVAREEPHARLAAQLLEDQPNSRHASRHVMAQITRRPAISCVASQRTPVGAQLQTRSSLGPHAPGRHQLAWRLPHHGRAVALALRRKLGALLQNLCCESVGELVHGLGGPQRHVAAIREYESESVLAKGVERVADLGPYLVIPVLQCLRWSKDLAERRRPARHPFQAERALCVSAIKEERMVGKVVEARSGSITLKSCTQLDCR